MEMAMEMGKYFKVYRPVHVLLRLCINFLSSNSAGNDNGNGNIAGSGNSAGNGNTVTFPSVSLKDRDVGSSLTNILGSVTEPSAGNDNIFKDNGDGNGNEDGNDNSAGNKNGNSNTAGSGNSAGNSNTVNFKERDLAGTASGITNTLGSITNPTAGSGNTFEGNGDGNGNGNGNGNSAGNGNGNGNTAGSNNEAGNGNTVNVSPDVSPSITLPDVSLPDITLPDISL